jgi:hypothetical protein
MIYLTKKQIEDSIIQKIKDKRPLSLIRLGDGEFHVIKYPLQTKEKLCRARIGRWFDADDLTRKEIMSIRNQIHRACQNADVLGIPSIGELKRYPKWKYFVKTCNRYKIFKPNQKHFYFYHIIGLDYKKILKDVDELYCITCRNIGSKIENNFNIKKVITYLIRGEKYAFTSNLKSNYIKWNGTNHFPDDYLKIIDWLSSTHTQGKVFLVGAGGLGKIYCNIIKKYGGVGIDVGALFDGWAGVMSRPYLKKRQIVLK